MMKLMSTFLILVLFLAACSKTHQPKTQQQLDYPNLTGYTLIVPGVWQKITKKSDKNTRIQTFVDYDTYREALVWVMKNNWQPYLENNLHLTQVAQDDKEYTAYITQLIKEGQQRLSENNWTSTSTIETQQSCNPTGSVSASYRNGNASAKNQCNIYHTAYVKAWSSGGTKTAFKSSPLAGVTVSASATAPYGSNCQVRAESSPKSGTLYSDYDFTLGLCY